MVSTIQSDIDGSQMSTKDSYKVSIFNRATGTHIDIDMSPEQVKKEKVIDAVKLALGNNVKWYKLQKDDSGKWNRNEVQ